MSEPFVIHCANKISSITGLVQTEVVGHVGYFWYLQLSYTIG